ncbi:Gfo/Idh/MocA family oxidoreductase [Azospirillum sp. YIM DDC1]|uniref:Gfo/Idh/MocA family oxidoreductase n=1 Tax=Azospirillum aestuarii TaxID=2802052 RepID=A0ABS1I907_9PROT|nr:Gfo/Idh/MocA family oxidoreductase [Azospirillum aestuarii]MBK4723173.1 Gfo/Idh/MocA family oxidoreductase [Azospirillum aestuarii]
MTATTASSSSSKGASSDDGHERPLGIGFVGAGMVGQLAHIANFALIPVCRPVALAELRPRLGGQARDRFGIARLYPDHRALLTDPEVEAVVVVTRRPATGGVVLDALEAGRHVLSEKPMAHSLAQAARLVDAARRTGVRYAVGFMKRHDAGYQRFKALYDGFLASGELGRVVFLRGYCHGGAFACNAEGFVMTDEQRPDGLEVWPEAPDWLPPALVRDYAWFLNVFVHDVNILRHLVGRSPEVTFADFRHANGRVVGFDWGGFSGILDMAEIPFADWEEGIEVLFERGRLRLRFPPPLLRNVPARIELERTGEAGAVARPAVPWSWAFRRQAEAFVADVRGGREPAASGEDSLADMDLIETMWRKAIALGNTPAANRD